MEEKVPKKLNVQVEETVEYLVADENDAVNERTKRVVATVPNEERKEALQAVLVDLDKKGLMTQPKELPERVVDV